MTELVLYDDAVAREFEPFALTRPACELRAGALLVRERWERALGMRATGVVTSDHLKDFDEPWAAGLKVIRGKVPAGAVLASSRCAVALSPAPAGKVWRCGNRVAAAKLGAPLDSDDLAGGNTTLESLAGESADTASLRGWWMDNVWDYIGGLAEMLVDDIDALSGAASRSGTALGTVSGKHGVFAEDDVVVEPHVHFDTSDGPVLIRRGATVLAFTRVSGPCVIGADSIVGGDKIIGCSIGERCKVHGEINAAIVLGHSNKSHDGFVGHSYLGRWVNLGAETVTSNLKNTYGSVELWTPHGERDTGRQFLGTLFGDHVKTAIGTMLGTGTVLGAGANVFGGARPPKVVPPFAWGATPPYSTYELDRFLDMTRSAMSRRDVELSQAQARLLTAAHERRWSEKGKG